MRRIEPLGSASLMRKSSSAVAITSTIASPIARTSSLVSVTAALMARIAGNGKLFLREAKRVTHRAMTTDTAAAAPISRTLFNFAIFYGGMVCIAGVLGNKQGALGPRAGGRGGW